MTKRQIDLMLVVFVAVLAVAMWFWIAFSTGPVVPGSPR
jgi:HAMP domain-containing protein